MEFAMKTLETERQFRCRGCKKTFTAELNEEFEFQKIYDEKYCVKKQCPI
jgi:hypothetical protein